MRVLVGYASRHGSTRDIARRVAETLESHGHRADVRPLGPESTPGEQAGEQAITDQQTAGEYDAYVLGSAIHRGGWLPEAAGFVQREQELTHRPVWLFSVGVAGRTGSRLDQDADEPVRIADRPEALRPVGEHRFAGALHRDHFGLPGRLLYRLMGGRYGDFRDWADVDDWAYSVVRDLSRVRG